LSTPSIDLSKLPVLDAVKKIDVDAEKEVIKGRMIDVIPEAREAIESPAEILNKLAGVGALSVESFVNYVNDRFFALLLPTSKGADLDHLASFVPLVRHGGESDDKFRARIQLAPATFSIAGPRDAYRALSLNLQSSNGAALLKDALAYSPQPSQVVVTVMAALGNGSVSQENVDLVSAALNAKEVRPLTDYVTVQSVSEISYNVIADLQVGSGPDSAQVKDAAIAAVQAYAEERHYIGLKVTLSGLYRALHQPGVENVSLTEPIGDLMPTDDEVAYLGNLTITVNGA